MSTTELTNKTTGDVTISSQRRQTNPAALYLLTLSEGSSRDGMEQILKRTARFFGFADWTDCPWQTITAAYVIGYRAILQKQGKSPATINLVLAAIKGVVRCAWQENLISDHERMVIDSIKSVKGSRVRSGRALTYEETATLFTDCLSENTAAGFRDAAILACGVGLGLRRAEIAGARLSKVDKTNCSLKIIGKGNKEREVFFPEQAWLLFEKWLQVRGTGGSDFVFCPIDRRGEMLYHSGLQPSAILQILQKRGIKSDLEKFSPHDLRRTFASRLLENGVDLSMVRDALGHSSIGTTVIYDHRGKEKLKQCLRNKVRL